MKANESKIAFIYFQKFFRIWTFQRVAGEKNKKIVSLVTRLTGCGPNVSNRVQPHSVARLPPSPVNESSRNICSTDFWFLGSQKPGKVSTEIALIGSLPTGPNPCWKSHDGGAHDGRLRERPAPAFFRSQ
jgi:hypothetical protein